MARLPLMAGNWKMNLNHVEAVGLVQKLAWTLDDKRHDPKRSEVVVLPPFTDLRTVQTLVEGDRLAIGYGAQDVSANDPGAFTGEISASMLAKLKCAYVTVGHSERRFYHHEDDALVNVKARKALEAGVTPIICVGEGLDVRQTPEDAQEVCGAIRGQVAELYSTEVAEQVRVLYGGSVKSGNVAAIMAQPDVDGCLVGGASLVVEEFSAIARFYDLPAL